MSVARLTTNPARGVYVVTWAALLNGESGDPGDIPLECATRSMQVAGTLGVGGTCIVEGSNDGINWAPLSDSALVALSFAALGIKDILQNTRFVRPRVTAGDGATSFKVILVAV